MDDLTSFEQIRDWLHSFVDFERRGFRRHFADAVNLDTIRELLRRLDDPQERFPSLHLAGTKGKGSTAALCEAALRAAGYRTGLYTSPHLLTMRERIRLDGAPVSEERLVELVRQVRPAAESLRDRGDLNPPTFFEIYTALGFLAFAEAGVEIAVVEPGLGGRLDATNVLRPLVTAITTVGRDHIDILGDTLGQIAGEKAGILKPGVPLALGEQEAEAEAVILARAAAVGAPVRRAPCPRLAQAAAPLRPPAEGEPLPRPAQRVLLPTAQGDLPVRLPLLGAHQLGNLGLAWTALELLGEAGLPVRPGEFQRGVETVSWPGRFELAEARPWLVLDCAQNVPSLRALAEALPATLRYRRLVLVFGISADKEIVPATAEIAPWADAVVLTQAPTPRAMWVSELAKATWGLWRSTPHIVWTVEEALQRARSLAGPEDCICVTGSVFVVGAALQALGRPVR